jgi:autotransporter-associated beta strand protein
LWNDTTGGTSRIEVFGNGYLDVSFHSAPGMTVGSVEGSGNIFLGANNLTVGSANLSTTFSGVIQDGGGYPGGGTGGSLTKVGLGTLILSGGNTYTGATTVSGGFLIITGSLGSTAAVIVASGGVLSGTGTINAPLTVNDGGVVDLTGGTFTINNSVTNNGLFILSHNSQLAGVTSFTNNGTLDIMTAGTFTPPPNFTNNGVIIDSSVMKSTSATLSGNTFTLAINSYSYHVYVLQGSTSLADSSFANIGSPQRGSTGNVLTFTDPNATGDSRFYRIHVSQ